MARLAGIRVLVSDGDGDVGRAVVSRLVAEGATVIAGTREPERIGQPETGPGSPRLRWVDMDVTDADSWRRAVAVGEGVVSGEGAEPAEGAEPRKVGAAGLHGLVTIATEAVLAPLVDLDRRDLDAMVDRNLIGAILGIQAVVPALRRSGGGAIVAIASTEALRGADQAAAFAATNWALRGLSRSAARELGVDGIRVNTVCPTIDLIASSPGLLDGTTPRPVTAGDIASMVAFLLSDDSATCSGGDYPVDGGATA
ncbi:MAG: SDR family oxidoreductase [Actinomycetota bacterium]